MKRAFLSGYVEGYYGRLPTFEERAGIVRKLREIGAGHYLYAPKEDVYHRREWRKPYPAAWRREFAAFVKASRKQGVTVVPGIAPGLSYRYRDVKDFETLSRKLLSLTELGCDEAALLMDDISVELPEADRDAYESLGEAHGLMLQLLWPRLRARGIRRLWFCPTVYSDFFAPEGVANSVYLRDLAPFLEPGIELMWTGKAIVSPAYAPADMRALGRRMGTPLVLWDNLYANDYCPGKIFLGPFAGRPKALLQACAGMMLNPTGLHHTDLFHLDLLGGFLRGEPARAAWKRALKAWDIPLEFETVASLFEPALAAFDRTLPAAKAPKPAEVRELRAALKPLIWDWKSPLKREWYPYLYAMDADLRLLETGKDAPDAAWVRKKYSVPVAARLLK